MSHSASSAPRGLGPRQARKIVVKVGTAVLAGDKGNVNRERILHLGGQVARLADRGHRMVLVSSGAIGAGIGELQLKGRPSTLSRLQATAAVGQAKLITAYDEAFQPYGYHAAQILLTREDIDNRDRYLNAAGTIRALHKLSAIPVVNENDTVSVDEIRVGDNDVLSALVARMLKADLLVILTCVDGLRESESDQSVVDYVEDMAAARRLVQSSKSALGSGGMSTKLAAVEETTKAGIAAVIANGRTEDVLLRLMDGEHIGTSFQAAGGRTAARKLWIGSASPKGSLVLDEGACAALRRGGRSLLATGITDVRGEFKRGEVVSLCEPSGREFARGLSNYSSLNCSRIRGLRTAAVAKVLGSKPYDAVVHCDNMLIL